MEDNDRIAALIAYATQLRDAARVDWKTAVRRTVGNTEWSDDPERVAAAEAKRASRMARNIRNAKREAK